MSLGRNPERATTETIAQTRKTSQIAPGVSQATISRIETGRVLQPGSSALKS